MKRKGFTLIELMIVVAIIGILASIVASKFSEVLRKAGEGASKGNLGSVRSALSIYYADLEGQYPGELPSLTVGAKYMSALPPAKAPGYHDDSSVVTNQLASNNAGGWSYNNVMGDVNMGTLWVNCTHTDTKGSIWTAY